MLTHIDNRCLCSQKCLITLQAREYLVIHISSLMVLNYYSFKCALPSLIFQVSTWSLWLGVFLHILLLLGIVPLFFFLFLFGWFFWCLVLVCERFHFFFELFPLTHIRLYLLDSLRIVLFIIIAFSIPVTIH